MRPLAFPCALILALFALLFGCSEPDSAEQLQADQDFARVQVLLAGGDHRASRQMLADLITRDRNLDRGARVAEELHLLARSYAATASFDSALLVYGSALEQYKSMADRPAARGVQLETALLYRRMGDERKAFALYTEMVRFARVFKDEEGLRAIQWAMLPSCRLLGEREDEGHVLAELLGAASASGDPAFTGHANLEAGISMIWRGIPDSASQHLLRAFTVAEKSPDSMLVCTSLLQLARAYDAAGKSTEALQTYGEALRRVDKYSRGKRIRQELLTRVGNVYLRNRQSAEAARFYRAALTSAINLKDKIAEGYLCVQLGHCEPAEKSEAALKYYRSALDLFSGYSYAPGIAYALLSTGKELARVNRVNEAIQQLTTSIQQEDAVLGARDADDLHAECVRAFFGQREAPAYDELIELLLQQGRTDEAFWYGGRRRAAIIFRALGAFRPRPARDSLSAALERYRRDRSLLIGAERQLEATLTHSSQDAQAVTEIRAALRTVQVRLVDESASVAALDPAYRPFVGVASPTIAEVRRFLPEGTALVHYLPTRRTMYALVISSRGASLEMAAAAGEKTTMLAAEFLDSLKTREAADSRRARALSGMLSAIFVRPIEANLAGVSRLFVILPDNMPLVPLHALRRSSMQSAYLAERLLVAYLPAADVLGLQVPPPSAVRDIIALGHAGGSDWDVEYELRDIRAFYKDTRLYFGQQATLATLKGERADLLHLAAEFRWDSRSPDNSSVVLPDSRSPEMVRSILQEEIVGLPPFPTVVLSNLAPGYSAIHPAEPYLFLVNGARTVIMDGYPPMRKTKKYFGEVFYTALLSGMPASDAFHRAQIEMIKNPDYRSIHTWGAFFLWGK
ncbi:MAG: tetratricopeptide [Bacteroidetes bacterium]|nr:tetratricopeptide [Bacteroidota bacterium]